MNPVLISLIGVVVGFTLGRLSDVYDRRRRRMAHMAALRAEINICERLAKTYLNDPVLVPLYRLPTWAFAAALPSLLADRALSEEQVDDLESFAGQVHDINRGLDNAHRALEKDDSAGVAREAKRLRGKCAKFLDAYDGHDAYITRARRAVGKGRLQRSPKLLGRGGDVQ